MNYNDIEQHLTSLGLHDNGCLRFLKKHSRQPAACKSRPNFKWMWATVDGPDKFSGRFRFSEKYTLPHFLTNKIERVDVVPGNWDYSVENHLVLRGCYCTIHKVEYDAFVDVCKAWDRMKSIHRLFLSAVPNLEDIYD